ncbi:alpha-tectorin-like [Centropristis striata]|uniref:alpha-tectorin-like n=1 Tax=Centropristis striata TaxID=184440 RepID=UPI0027DEC37E|nr:alpha-tectorin-like [Centropristis striata]
MLRGRTVYKDTEGDSQQLHLPESRNIPDLLTAKLHLFCFSTHRPDVYCRGSIMAKPGALLLLLAVAAHLGDIQSTPIAGEERNHTVDISNCTIHFFGRPFSMIDVFFKQDSTIALCFKNNANDTAQDCLLLLNGNITKFIAANVTQDKEKFEPEVLPRIMTSSSDCSVALGFGEDEGDIMWKLGLYPFGVLAAVRLYPPYLSTTKMEAWVANTAVKPFLPTNISDGFFWDISGCRALGEVLPTYSEIIHRENCTKVKCNANTTTSSESTCQLYEECLGNNMCHLPSALCTVTGPNVIDFFSRVHTVTDRCGYRLLNSIYFAMAAVFRERRRRDVPFLDHLMFTQVPSNEIFYLEQAGRVRVGQKVLSLNATALEVHGVYLSADATGVTAKLPKEGVEIFFDGNTVHLLVKKQLSVGLCGNLVDSTITTTMPEMRISSPGCLDGYSDAVDSTINCAHSTARCQLMNQAPFSACHEHINPSSYIEACINTTCVYPSKDGFSCQHFEAYAKSCSLLAPSVNLQNWRSPTHCPAAPEGSCPDNYCSDHEFCVPYPYHCHCRAIFASKYKPKTFGGPTICKANSATVSLVGCLLKDHGIHHSHLTLNDKNCTGDYDSESHMITFSFDSTNTCGAKVMTNKNYTSFENSIMEKNVSATSLITHETQFVLDFSCSYKTPEVRTMSFKIKDGSIEQKIVSGFWNYTLIMNAYTDPGHLNAVKMNTKIRLNQRIWVELKAKELGGKLVALVTDSCWATNLPAHDSSPKYDIIVNGCPNPADNTVNVIGNGMGTSNSFSFGMFEFIGGSPDVYLHCETKLCATSSQSCAPTCGGVKRKRRSAWQSKAQKPRESDSPALMNMIWNDDN